MYKRLWLKLTFLLGAICFVAPCWANHNYLIIIDKGKRTLTLLDGSNVVSHTSVSLGRNPIGHKIKEGDNRTPEGKYYVAIKKPNSRFRKSLILSYPNKQDIENAKSRGVNPGSGICIHGESNRFSFFRKARNWTRGCIAVKNKVIDELYNLVNVGTPVIIKP